MSEVSTPTRQTRNRILDAEGVQQKIVRIAYEILEDNYGESDLVLAGICHSDEGYALAERLTTELRRIDEEVQIHLTAINLDKDDPTSSPIETGLQPGLVNGKVVVIVDDVANTGRTLLYAVKPLLELSPRKIRLAVLVDRKHKAYPISADYVGMSLSTTLHEHIDVELSEGVFLS